MPSYSGVRREVRTYAAPWAFAPVDVLLGALDPDGVGAPPDELPLLAAQPVPAAGARQSEPLELETVRSPRGLLVATGRGLGADRRPVRLHGRYRIVLDDTRYQPLDLELSFPPPDTVAPLARVVPLRLLPAAAYPIVVADEPRKARVMILSGTTPDLLAPGALVAREPQDGAVGQVEGESCRTSAARRFLLFWPRSTDGWSPRRLDLRMDPPAGRPALRVAYDLDPLADDPASRLRFRQATSVPPEVPVPPIPPASLLFV